MGIVPHYSSRRTVNGQNSWGGIYFLAVRLAAAEKVISLAFQFRGSPLSRYGIKQRETDKRRTKITGAIEDLQSYNGEIGTS